MYRIITAVLMRLSHFLNQLRARGWRAPGFLKLLLSGSQYVCVDVCVSAPEAMNN